MEKKTVIILAVVGGVLALIAALLASSLKKLDSYEVGIQYDTIWKRLAADSKGEGLHTGPPGYEFIVFPSVFQTIEFERLSCLNRDGVPIYLDVSYQYRAKPVSLQTIIKKFRNHDEYKKVLEYAGKTATMEACSLYNTTQFQTERGAFQEAVGKRLVERYDELYCDVSEIQVNNIERPSQYETAIKDKESARENIQVAENERPRKITQATTKEREAETQALITVQKAESESRIINNRAQTEAAAILEVYAKEAEVYLTILDSQKLGFTKDGFLSYIGVRAISSAKNPVYVGMQGPAKTSYMP